ncbi:MAG: hypothetical protein ABJA60_10695, partial [Nitrosospira sp.]
IVVTVVSSGWTTRELRNLNPTYNIAAVASHCSHGMRVVIAVKVISGVSAQHRHAVILLK